MGAGASAQAGIFGPPDGTVDPEAEWRSENVRELDRLGGNQRPPIRRGLSTKYRLEWLKEALHEQGDRLEEALAKDPMAGRHEIMRQEAAKLARSINLNPHRFTVREWQTLKHTDLRAQQAREELERRLRERDKSRVPDQDRPAWNSLHWSQSNFVRRTSTTLVPGGLPLPSMPSPTSPPDVGSKPSTPALGQRPQSPTSNAPAAAAMPPGVCSPPQPSTLSFSPLELVDEREPQPHVVRPIATVRTGEPPAEWRLRILRAKRKAMMVISVVLAFRGRKHRARGLQRLDSLSFFIAMHLGSDLQRFAEEQSTYRVTRATAADLQALAEEVWRENNYSPDGDLDVAMLAGDTAEPPDAISSLAMTGPLGPGSPRTPTMGPSSPRGGGGGFKAPAPPQLRMPPATGSGAAAAGSVSGNGRSGSPLLKSRPINLTPTLHHPAPTANGNAPALPHAASAPCAGSVAVPGAPSARSLASDLHPHNGGAATCGGAATGAGGGGGGGAGAGGPTLAAVVAAVAAASGTSGTSLSGPLPVLRGHSARMSMPSGVAPSHPGLEAEPSASSGNAMPAGPIGSSLVSKSHRFSAPGCEPAALLGVPGGIVAASLSPDEGSPVSIGDVVPASASAMAMAANAGLPPPSAPAGMSGNSKRWSSPRFHRRGGAVGAAADGHASEPQGPTTQRNGHGAAGSTGVAGSRHRGVPPGAMLAAEDMSMVSRAQSWAGPSPLHQLVVHTGGGGGGGGGGGSVGHSRSIGHDHLPLSPSGAGPSPPGGAAAAHGVVLPAPPSLPSPVNRNPRKRRESGLILTGSSSTLSLPQAGHPHPPIVRSPTTSGDGYTNAAAAAAVAAVSVAATVATPARGNRHGGGVSRSGSAVTASSVTSSGGSGSVPRRPARLGGSVPGEPGNSVFGPSPSLHGDRPGSVASERALRCNSTIRRMVRDGSSDQLYMRYQEEAAALERPLRMMQLFANRANARWVEELGGAPQLANSGSSSSLTGLAGGAAGGAASTSAGATTLGWEPPYVYDGTRFSSSVGAAQASVFRAEVATMLRAGRMAIQLLAGDEQIVIGNGPPVSLWNADPWDLIATSFPAKVAAADRVRQVYMGPRLMMALVSAVEALAGPEAVAKLVVVLHVNDTQQADVARELKYRKFCGLRPENLILCVQQRRPGYYWDNEQTVFVPDTASPLASAGNGYAIMQLVWAEEAHQVEPDEPGKPAVEAPSWATAGGAAASAAAAAAAAPPTLVPLGTSVLDHLASRGVEWLTTRRLRDINLYNPDSTMDAEVLSYSLYLHEHLGANMAVQVEMADSVGSARAAQTGVVLAPPRQRRANSTGSAATAAAAAARHAMTPRRAGTFAPGSSPSGGGTLGGAGVPVRVGSDVTGASQPELLAIQGTGLHPHIVMDVKHSDTATPRTIQMLTDLRTKANGKLAVSTRRYMWRVEVLQTLVQRSSLFHPSLDVAGDLAYLTFDMADLTTATDCGARCVAVSSGRPVRSLNAVTDLEELFGAILAQDAHAPFRRLAANISPAYGPSHGVTNGGGGAIAAAIPNLLSPAVTATAGGTSSRPGTSAGGQHAAAASSDIRNLSAGQTIIVLLAENESTAMAVQLLMSLVKPGKDRVILVTVVSSVLQEPSGRMLLRKHEMSLMRTMVEVTTELLTKNSNGSLIDQLESFIDERDPQLVVMGSQLLATATTHAPLMGASGGGAGGGAGGASSGGAGGGTGGGGAASSPSSGGAGMVYGSSPSFAGGGGGGAAVLGSVAVSLLRNATRPMLIVKANAKFASVAWDKDKLRVLVEVHHSSRNMLRYVCAKLASAPRHDKLFLTRGGAKDLSQQETVTSRRLLENFSDIATQYHVPAVKRALEESFEAGAIKWADHDKVHIIALHAPAGRGISNATFSILRAARSAVLVYRSSETQ